jgi:hypothetical protein
LVTVKRWIVVVSILSVVAAVWSPQIVCAQSGEERVCTVSHTHPVVGEIIKITGKHLWNGELQGEGPIEFWKKQGSGDVGTWQYWCTYNMTGGVASLIYAVQEYDDFQVRWQYPVPFEDRKSNTVRVTVGTNQQSKSVWYLAEGSTGSDAQTQFETWVLVVNPTGQKANVTVSYQTDKGPVNGPTFIMDPGTRTSINVADTVQTWNVSTMVQSDQHVLVERSMYWNGRRGGHSSLGVEETGGEWICPEGSTRGGFETWVLIQNPQKKEATCDLMFMTDTGMVDGPTITVGAQSRTSICLNNVINNRWSVSTKVTSDQDVIVERSSYFGNRQEGTDSNGYLIKK